MGRPCGAENTGAKLSKELGPGPQHALNRLLEATSLPAFDLGPSICIGSREAAKSMLSRFNGDSVAFEAFHNSVQLSECHPLDGVPMTRSLLFQIGMVIMRSWAVSLLPLLGQRTVLFYIGGRELNDMALRFHVERSNQTWFSLERSALERERLLVYRLTEKGLLSTTGRTDEVSTLTAH